MEETKNVLFENQLYKGKVRRREREKLFKIKISCQSLSQKIFFKFINELFYFLLYALEKSIGFVKIFEFRFSMDLHVLGYPEHDLTIFRKCLSVCLCVCVDVCLCVCVSVTKILWQV